MGEELWEKNFLIIVIGNFTSRIGTVVYDISLAWWLIDATGTAKYTGYIMAISLLPIVVLGPISGVFSDKWNKKYILVISDIISGIASIGVSIMAYYGVINIPMLLVSTFILGLTTSIYKPSIKSIIPKLIKRESLLKANSVTSSMSETAKVVGPMFAGLLLAVPSIGIPGALFFNGVSFFINSIFEMFIKYEHFEENSKSNVFEKLNEGFGYVLKNILIKKLLILCALVNIFLTSFNILLPLFIKKVMQESGSFYSRALTAEAVGGIAVILIVLLLKEIKPNTNMLAGSIIIMGVSLSTITFFTDKNVILLCIFFIGLTAGIFNTLFSSLVQSLVDKSLLGRVFSIVFMLATIVQPLSYFVFGQIGDYVINNVFLYSGIGIITCCTILISKKQKSEKVEENAS